MTRSYGPRTRTDKDRLRDALLFVFGATPAMIAYKTADQIADEKGVVQAANRKQVAAALLRRQLNGSV